MLHLGRRHLHQAPADSIHEGLDAVISKKRQLLLDFLRGLLTKFHILCRRVLVLRRRDDASARQSRCTDSSAADGDDSQDSHEACVHDSPLALGIWHFLLE